MILRFIFYISDFHYTIYYKSIYVNLNQRATPEILRFIRKRLEAGESKRGITKALGKTWLIWEEMQ